MLYLTVVFSSLDQNQKDDTGSFLNKDCGIKTCPNVEPSALANGICCSKIATVAFYVSNPSAMID